ncbi:hypothetical protein [Pantoea sp. App145]|uniref:hypothetical protein n=1 Tax=Pantoea sp. App145 TaxID=3071567 RepID=UPI003A801F6C
MRGNFRAAPGKVGSVPYLHLTNPFLTALRGIGKEIVVKNTIWTEYALAQEGDRILLGVSTEAEPPDSADDIRQIVQFADTFERLADDFALITGV